MGHEEKLIGIVVSLVAMCGLLIRYVLKRNPESASDDKDSAKRLARLQAEQEKERERRLHQHFRDYREFADAMRSSVRELGFRAGEMEKDVMELRKRFEDELEKGSEYRERILAKLASMEGAARAFATFAQSARRTLEQPGEDA